LRTASAATSLKSVAPQLSEDQFAIIRQWAESIAAISEVRLFGSRARGEAGVDSGTDLAVRVQGGQVETPLQIWLGLHLEWKNELEAMLQSRVSLEFYHPDSADARAAIDEDAIVIWTRGAAT
jgi:predicted nucleotidyltransferase